MELPEPSARVLRVKSNELMVSPFLMQKMMVESVEW
jgi:hypothetical protein